MGSPAARLNDPTVHGGTIVGFEPTVIIGGMPAARLTDMHVCPQVTVLVPHVGGPLILGSLTVLTGFLPQSRVGDPLICVGPPDAVAMGEPTVIVGMAGGGMGFGAMIAGLMAALMDQPGGPASVLPPPPPLPETPAATSSAASSGGGGSASGPALISNGADAIVSSDKYKDCPDAVKKQIQSKDFSDQEKKDLDEVLEKYKPLMKCSKIPLKKIGRSGKAITKNGTCVAETDTMGEWFDDSGTVVLTDAASKPVDFKDKDTQFKATAAHEMAHAMLNGFDPRTCKTYADSNDNPVMKEFHKASGWDATGTTLVETADNKAPTNYAKTNDQEDLSESMMLYMYDPDKLQKASPARYDFCKKMLGE